MGNGLSRVKDKFTVHLVAEIKLRLNVLGLNAKKSLPREFAPSRAVATFSSPEINVTPTVRKVAIVKPEKKVINGKQRRKSRRSVSGVMGFSIAPAPSPSFAAASARTTFRG